MQAAIAAESPAAGQEIIAQAKRAGLVTEELESLNGRFPDEMEIREIKLERERGLEEVRRLLNEQRRKDV
jgi:hypothetical protein